MAFSFNNRTWTELEDELLDVNKEIEILEPIKAEFKDSFSFLCRLKSALMTEIVRRRLVNRNVRRA